MPVTMVPSTPLRQKKYAAPATAANRRASIQVCTSYRYNGKLLREFPTDLRVLQNCEPVYESLPGWQQPTSNAGSWDELPEGARKYLEYLETQTGALAKVISVGSKRNQTIFRESTT